MSSADSEGQTDVEIHVSDSSTIIPLVGNAGVDMVLNGELDHNSDHLRRQLSEFASELLRLQEGTDIEPRQTGVFAPEALRRWTETSYYGAPNTPEDPSTLSASAATPKRNTQTAPLDSLPTPTSASDGRHKGAELLRSHIEKMRLNDETATADSSSKNRIADFTGEIIPGYYEELRLEKGKAEAEAALLGAEIVALRGRHDEEKRQLIKTAKDLRRRNEELESLVTVQRMGSNVGRAENGRSVSCSRIAGGQDGEGDNKFGFRMRALAQRWASPHPAKSSQYSAPNEEGEREAMSRHESSSTINTNEDFGQVDTLPENGESMKLIAALEEQLRQTENRAAVLEKRLDIVKESGDAVIQSLNEELADVADDRARSEAAMIKELSILDSRRRAERNEFEKRIQEWIVHDANRKLEVEEYETKIESLLGTVQMMTDDQGNVGTTSSSWDGEAEQEMYNDLIEYIKLLGGKSKGGMGNTSLVMSINDAFDLEFNANPTTADKMLEYYRSRPELKEFTLKSELPRMRYNLLVVDEETGKGTKFITTEEIRSYFTSFDESTRDDEETDIILRAANQSLLADPMAMLTSEGEGMLVHSGSFHSTLIATDCSFKLDLRREGQRLVKVHCELAICVPSGMDGSNNTIDSAEGKEKNDNSSPTLELARANLVIQFSPSPTSTPSGPLVKYCLMDIIPTMSNFEEGSDNTRAIHSAAAVLARDRHSQIQCKGNSAEARPNVKSRFLSKVKQISSSI